MPSFEVKAVAEHNVEKHNLGGPPESTHVEADKVVTTVDHDDKKVQGKLGRPPESSHVEAEHKAVTLVYHDDKKKKGNLGRPPESTQVEAEHKVVTNVDHDDDKKKALGNLGRPPESTLVEAEPKVVTIVDPVPVEHNIMEEHIIEHKDKRPSWADMSESGGENPNPSLSFIGDDSDDESRAISDDGLEQPSQLKGKTVAIVQALEERLEHARAERNGEFIAKLSQGLQGARQILSQL